jgi:flagellar motility protein MotE (MotC chaperone)
MKLSSLLLLLTAMIGCGGSARADAEPEPAAVGCDTGDIDEPEASLDDDPDDASKDPPELELARANVDAAIAASADRGETERVALAQQRNELTALQTELDARLAGVDKLEGRIDELLGAGKVAEDRRAERTDLLANLIASMSPQAAATVLAQMSDAEAQELLFAVAQSDKRRAAKLIATMPAGRAAAIGQRYLSRDPKAIGERLPSAPAVEPAKPEPAPGPAAPETEPSDSAAGAPT